MQLLRKIAYPVSLVYGLVVYLRNYMYHNAVFTSNSFKTPTICVGNLSVGGTGKTPMVEFLVSHLKDTNKIAVLSRGYKRKSKGFIWADQNSSVEELGDEPYQIHTKFPKITVTVDADRSHGISMLEQKGDFDVILLDDAYQHRKVKPGFMILLTAYGHLYCDDWYLPTGNLRDNRREAKRADLIVVTKCPPNLEEGQQQHIKKKLKPTSKQRVVFSSLSYDQDLKGNEESKLLNDLKGKRVTLITGIANPEPLLSFMNDEQISVEHLSFRDHHFFSDKEITLFNEKDFIITTEKDYMRLKGKVNKLYYIAIQHEFIGDGKEKVVKAIADFIS